MRSDAFGFFWNDKPVEKAGSVKMPRVAPPIPETGWVMPKEFPRLDSAKVLGIDTETKDPELLSKGPGVRRGCKIAGVSISADGDKSWYFPVRHEMGDNLPVKNVMRWLKDTLKDPRQTKIGTNLLYDLDFLQEEGVQVEGKLIDVQIAEALLDENADGYDLDSMAMRHVGRGKVTSVMQEWIERAFDGPYKSNIYRAPATVVGPYAEADALLPIHIHLAQQKLMERQFLMPLWEIETGLTRILLAMRRRGVRVDMKHATRVEAKLEALLSEEQTHLNHDAGFEFNVDAKEHLIKLFDARGLQYPMTEPSKRFPDGQPSFVKEFLEHHPDPVAQRITSIRKWTKFRDTFIRGYIYDMQINGRVHCLFNQLRGDEYGTVSGRFSSSLPNLQNIPTRDEIWGPLIRAIFLPEPGEMWGKLDWSQVEYRILVHRGIGDSADEARRRYNEDPTTDFHAWVAMITGVSRGHAKNINFGLVYGMGVALLASQLGLTIEQAEPIFAMYHSNVPFVKELYDATSGVALRDGFITTLMGRRRRFDLWEPRQFGQGAREIALPMRAAIAKWGPRVRRAYTHKALNGDIQGSAADLMKKAMRDYYEIMMTSVLGAPLLTVHDELDFSVPRNKQGREALLEVKHLMETTHKLSVPLLADMKTGKNWGAIQ